MQARRLRTPQEYVEAVKISTIAFVGKCDPEKVSANVEEELRKNDGSAEFWGSFGDDGAMTSHMINNI